MMDANLDLQIAAAEEVRANATAAYTYANPSSHTSSSTVCAPAMETSQTSGTSSAHAHEGAAPAAPAQRKSLFDLAPQILMLCSGGLQPFDFKLSPDQHHELFLAGQLFTHLHAAQLGRDDGLPPVLSDEQKMKVLLLILYLDPYGAA